MPLQEIELKCEFTPLPKEVEALLDVCDERIDRFDQDHRDSPVPAFVPCDFVAVYRAFEEIENKQLAVGHYFLEWGSGIGAATCCAALLGYNATGIEINTDLVEISLGLAEDYQIEAEFICGSFVPRGGEDLVGWQEEITWLETEGDDAYQDLEMEVEDFDLIYAYPWPGEEQIVFDIFEKFASNGALLLTFHGQEGLRLQRKTLR